MNLNWYHIGDREYAITASKIWRQRPTGLRVVDELWILLQVFANNSCWHSTTLTNPAYLCNVLSTCRWRTHVARIIVGWMCKANHRTIFNRILDDAWSAIAHERWSVRRIFPLAGEVYRSKYCNASESAFILDELQLLCVVTASVTQCKRCEMWLTVIDGKLVRRQLSASIALSTGNLFSTICCSMDSTTHKWTVRIYGFILVIEFAKCTLHSLFRPWIDSLSSHACPNKSKISSNGQRVRCKTATIVGSRRKQIDFWIAEIFN